MSNSSSSSSDHHTNCPPISPRISFSNDFADSHHPQHYNQVLLMRRNNIGADEPPATSDFEFSVTKKNSSISTADELFFKGHFLPFKPFHTKTTTLRDELLLDDDGSEQQQVSLRPPKSSTRWKGLLGLNKSHIGSKKSPPTLIKTSSTTSQQEMLNEGGSSCRDVEIGI